MSKETGGQAFPEPVMDFGQSRGMTLRDYFAAKAMQGMLSNPGMWDLLNERHAQSVAKDAYIMADAMLKARNN
ncbi:hypothetical protein MWS75_003719 [Serratia marcescens]|nr:hypothetical protein [Serratia marcescens]EJA2551641.1 hypothetical protein [Serratia marcescens]EJA2596549.1 hypothetical protein [Serratia marcescens]